MTLPSVSVQWRVSSPPYLQFPLTLIRAMSSISTLLELVVFWGFFFVVVVVFVVCLLCFDVFWGWGWMVCVSINN